MCWQAFSCGYQVGLRQRWGTWPWEIALKLNGSLFRACGDASEQFSLPSRGRLTIRSSPLAFRKSSRNAGSVKTAAAFQFVGSTVWKSVLVLCHYLNAEFFVSVLRNVDEWHDGHA